MLPPAESVHLSDYFDGYWYLCVDGVVACDGVVCVGESCAVVYLS